MNEMKKIKQTECWNRGGDSLMSGGKESLTEDKEPSIQKSVVGAWGNRICKGPGTGINSMNFAGKKRTECG